MKTTNRRQSPTAIVVLVSVVSTLNSSGDAKAQEVQPQAPPTLGQFNNQASLPATGGQKTAQSAYERAKRVDNLIAIVNDDNRASTAPAEVLAAIRTLGYLHADEALPALIKRIAFVGGVSFTETSPTNGRPVLKCLTTLMTYRAQATTDALVAELSSGKTLDDGGREIWSLLLVNQAQAYGHLRGLLSQYREEYALRAKRHWILARQIKGVGDYQNETGAQPVRHMRSANPEKNAMDIGERSYELLNTITSDTLSLKDESHVVDAIEQISAFNYSIVADALTEKLDSQAPPSVLGKILEDPFPFLRSVDETPRRAFVQPLHTINRGLQSRAIEEAAIQSLQQMGQVALPSLVTAIAQRDRRPRYRRTALQLIVRASGGVEQAKEVLENAAKENEQKAANLTKVIDSIPTDE